MRRVWAVASSVVLICFASWSMTLGMAVPVIATTEQELQEINQQWETSAHALNDVNCASCHQNSETGAFEAIPTHESCQSCHEDAVDTFLFGKHGIRLLEEQTPLTPSMARLPMKHEAFDKQMNCNACHDVHTVNTVQASVDACLTCHNDNHSLNYKNSKHAKDVFATLKENPELPRPGAEAVTCATCHLPRTAQKKGDVSPLVKVNHNNTYNLKPADRMVGDVCMSCHGLEYSYNSIFDEELVEANFDRPPTLSHESFDLMKAAEKRRAGNASAPDGE
ncbi:MAG: cytochrome c3 family protein [Cyanobacteria bacterium P01_F01_bin.53]